MWPPPSGLSKLQRRFDGHMRRCGRTRRSYLHDGFQFWWNFSTWKNQAFRDSCQSFAWQPGPQNATSLLWLHARDSLAPNLEMLNSSKSKGSSWSGTIPVNMLDVLGLDAHMPTRLGNMVGCPAIPETISSLLQTLAAGSADSVLRG